MAGELDAHTAPSFPRVIERLRGQGVPDVRLDMSELMFFDSAGRGDCSWCRDQRRRGVASDATGTLGRARGNLDPAE